MQAEGEAVHCSQQYDELRDSVGIQNKPGATERTSWPSTPGLLLSPL